MTSAQHPVTFDDDTDGLCPDCGEFIDMCECRVGDECGRWRNGKLSRSCTLAGTEFCDFDCPYSRSDP